MRVLQTDPARARHKYPVKSCLDLSAYATPLHPTAEPLQLVPYLTSHVPDAARRANLGGAQARPFFCGPEVRIRSLAIPQPICPSHAHCRRAASSCQIMRGIEEVYKGTLPMKTAFTRSEAVCSNVRRLASKTCSDRFALHTISTQPRHLLAPYARTPARMNLSWPCGYPVPCYQWSSVLPVKAPYNAVALDAGLGSHGKR